MSSQQGLEAAVIEPFPADRHVLSGPSPADLIDKQLVVGVDKPPKRVSECAGRSVSLNKPDGLLGMTMRKLLKLFR